VAQQAKKASEKKDLKSSEYEIAKVGQEEVLKLNYIRKGFLPSIEDSKECMGDVFDRLIENTGISKIVIFERRNYEYDFNQVQMLVELVNIYRQLMRQKILNFAAMGLSLECVECFPKRFSELKYIILDLLKSDPIGAYVELKRMFREEKILLAREQVGKCVECRKIFLDTLSNVFSLLDNCKLIKGVKTQLDGYRVGDRAIYRFIFKPIIGPSFIFTKLMTDVPVNGREIDVYSLNDGSEVVVFSVPGDIKYLYHLTPPEFKISEDKYMLLDLAKGVMAEHRPRAEEFIDPERMRRVFLNIGRDLLHELAESKEIQLSISEEQELAEILVRYTVGFGLIEVLLSDKKIQDIHINGPVGQTNIFVIHETHGECVTNIIPSLEDGEGWATKFRLVSGRPLDEANPVLDTELVLPNVRARVAIITNPLSPFGYGYSLRRHRDEPWTYPLFIKNRMINPLAAGLLSFLIDGGRTILFSGTRSGGKTSLMVSSMLELMRKYRIISVEDTLEIPNDVFRRLGYNIQAMKVRSALMSGGGEMSADEGIRTSLRMGDSSLVIGEVRSLEAKSLYEAMRIGALANVVMGTIHGADPYSVFDRVVNDLQVPRTSFKATDIIVIANPIKSPDGLHRWRRVIQISEVRKHWEEDPLREAGFVDLMKYNPETDELEATPELNNGESDVLKSIASNVKEWSGNWDAVWENILLRAKIKKALVDSAEGSKRQDLLEAEFAVKANDWFHKVSEEVVEKIGRLDSGEIFKRWEAWLKTEIKKGIRYK